ncbi:MAG: hypothetical protein EA381_16575 [Planctomycetaceae bacterium]|nr:MAG: hypothetical protein EA381_16575 [Planctomycetaceae bacterium]
MIQSRTPILAVALPLILTIPCLAEVGDPTVRTDHPVYPGEGAFQEIEDCVAFATRGKTASQDQAIALYRWLLMHQYHLMSPQECVYPGESVDTEGGNGERVVYDANRARFSYGYGLCGTVHAWNEPYWQALGMPARRRAFPGHTNSEVFYDGSWHAYDTDMAGILFRPDGVVAGYEDIIADPRLITAVQPPLPHYPFAWPGDFEAMKRGWTQVAEGGDWFKMYNSGYAAHPGIVHLRSGETWTRYFDRDHFGGPAERRFWHHAKGGPYRTWTFVNTDDTAHDGAEVNARGNASYANGEFVYSPSLADERFREGIRHAAENLGSQPESPRLHSRDGQPTSVVFGHFSPYVIAGKPVDGENPMTGKATDGLVLVAKFVGEVACRVSTDDGQTWQQVPVEGSNPQDASGRVRADLTERVKGHYGWQVAFDWAGAAGIDELTFTTTTQVSQSIYPRLKPGGSKVRYRAASRGVVASLPNFSLPETECDVFEEVSMRSKNLRYHGLGGDSRLAYETTDNRPGQVVFRLDSPQPLREVRAAFRYSIRSPAPSGSEFSMEVSIDNGRTWRQMGRSDIPEDNEFSSGWLAGSAEFEDSTATAAFVRCNLYAGGYRTGLLQVQLYGIHETATPQELELAYGWEEAGEEKSWSTKIPANTAEQTFELPTGQKITDRYIRMTAP